MTKVLKQQLVDTKKLTDIIVTLLIMVGAFLVPTFLAKIIPLGKYQQIVVGTIVNTALIMTALYTKGSIKTIFIATLPSMSNILGGYLFTPMTLYAKLMIPAIIFAGFSIMNSLINLPAKVQTVLNTSMGVTQLITATCGSILALAIMSTVKMCTKKTE